MRWIIILAWCITGFQIQGQETYSKKYDIDQDAIRNIMQDFDIADNSIFTYSTTFCDLENDHDATCLALTKFSISGDVLNVLLIDSFNSYDCCFEGLTSVAQNLIFSTYAKGEKHEILSVYNLDSELNINIINKYDLDNSSSQLSNSGVEYINGSLFIYGSIKNIAGVPDSVRIIKTDLDGNEIWRKYYSYGNSGLDINNLQSTPDGNLAFILEINSPNGANNGFDGYQLMKIDTSGTVLDSFVFKDANNQPNRLLAASDGGYVFSSINHPFNGHDIFTTGYGLINKMDANMDTLEWSLILPNDQLVDGRHYRMWDYIETSNGDIVACGMAYDNRDTELATGVPDKNSTWNGFIIRLTPDGEIVWLHLYKNPNDLLPQDEYGRFRPSRLNKLKELPDGRFIAAGDVFINNKQASGINEQETEAFHLWLLMVDENGCLDGYDCEEIIRINPKGNVEFNIGNQWVYEEENYFGGGNTNVGYRSFAIQDTFFDGVRTKYVIGVQDTFYVEDNKMFFWDTYYQEYIMYYDWQETTSYEIKYYDPFRDSEEMATVVIDSINYEYFGNDSLKVQHIHILNSGTLEDYIDVVYKGIGASYFGIKFLLGCGLCDDNPYTTKLRCFTNDTMTYNFVPYSCDSTWLTTSVDELIKNDIRVYPNPTSGRLNIDGLDNMVFYYVYDLLGTLVQSGYTKDIINISEGNGLLILKLKVEKNWIIKKVMKIE